LAVGDRSMNPGTVSPWHRLDRTLARMRPYRQPLSLVVDGSVVILAWNFTYLFRLGFERWWSARPAYDAAVMLAVALGYLGAFSAAGIPKGMWRFSGFGEVKRLTIACTIAGLAGAVVTLMLNLREVPRAVLALHPFVSLIGLCMVRIAYRMVYEHARSRILGSDQDLVRRAIVMGAGEAARLLLAGLHQQGWTVLGLLDDAPDKRGARIAGVPVLGTLSDVQDEGIRAGATHVVTAMPGATAAERRRAIELAVSTGLPVLTVPSFSELRDGTARVERVRAIEAEDLLGRDPVVLDERGVSDLLSGQVVLITGAGGSIGSELCRQIALYGPSKVVLYELSELALYQIEQELSETHPHLPLVKLLGDVKSEAHLLTVFKLHRPNIVFHAAAFKHVPLMEEDNAWAALQNNTVGTWNVANAAVAVGVDRVVLVSTDKAVNPTNVMGASKRAAEMIMSYMASQGHETRFVAVRFGNVLGSSGSVIPKFKEQIARGGPITVTHPDITRYFMTIPEAVRLVIQSAAMAESGAVYVLDMGEPVRIVDLARDLIRLSGHRRDEIGITFTGLRPGEKLYEELLADSDETLPSRHPRLRVARLNQRGDDKAVLSLIEWLRRVGTSATAMEYRDELAKAVPEYRPAGVGR
jgi:FlaA1/EpsC-like NDP-sugar epimerase